MLVHVHTYVWSLFDIWISDSGGDCEVIVATNEEIKISPVREAFQSVFGKATVS